MYFGHNGEWRHDMTVNQDEDVFHSHCTNSLQCTGQMSDVSTGLRTVHAWMMECSLLSWLQCQ